jgi:hypothetical protein
MLFILRETRTAVREWACWLGGGGALKKIAPSGGRRENCWGISCEKSRFYAKKSFCPILGGRGGAMFRRHIEYLIAVNLWFYFVYIFTD